MKRTIAKIGKTGKRVTAIFSFITAFFAVWALIKVYTRKEVTGEWYVEFKVEKSSYRPYIGESHTQKIYFTQTDASVRGKAEKWEYNGKLLKFDMHRKLEYEGAIDGSILKATFVLHGRDRDSEGIICVEISGDGKTMTGTFSGTAGTTFGTVKGERRI